MLATDPRMQGIDNDHWRNLQSLVTISAKARPRIVIIHEAGVVQKFAHSAGTEIVRDIATVDDARAVAEHVFNANSADADFVAVFERTAVDTYYARLQDSWNADEDLDAYLHRSFELMDEFPTGIVTYPGPARTQLGLQWRLGATYGQIHDAVRRYLSPDTVAVFGVTSDDHLWASLVLRFDAARKIAAITTARPGQIAAGDHTSIARQVVDQVGREHGTVSLGLFAERSTAESLIRDGVTLASLRQLAQAGTLTTNPIPPALRDALAALSEG